MPHIHIHPATWICIAVFVICDFSVYTLITFAAAAVHESGHIVAALALGSEIQCVNVYPLGAEIRLSTAHSYITEIVINSAGIIANLFAFAVSAVFFGGEKFLYFAVCNLSLAAVNAFPVRSLDGGELLSCIILLFTDPSKAYRISRAVSFSAVFLMWLAAVYLLIYFDGNLSLFLLAVYLFITVFLRSGGKKQ